MEIKTVKINPHKDCNTIIRKLHFIKTAEKIYKVLVNYFPKIQFGLSFCESSGSCLVRHEENNLELSR